MHQRAIKTVQKALIDRKKEQQQPGKSTVYTNLSQSHPVSPNPQIKFTYFLFFLSFPFFLEQYTAHKNTTANITEALILATV